MKGFDDHLDNYGDPGGSYPGEIWDGPGDDWYPGSDDDVDLAEQDEYWGMQEIDDGITTDDFDNWPREREFPS